MKKVFLLLPIAIILIVVTSFSVKADDPAPIQVTLFSEFFTRVEAGEQIPAKMETGNVDLQPLYCKATEQSGYISCYFPEKYAGMQVPVALKTDDAMYVYVVEVPNQK